MAKATFRLWPLSCHTNARACSPGGVCRATNGCEHGRTTSMAIRVEIRRAQVGRRARAPHTHLTLTHSHTSAALAGRCKAFEVTSSTHTRFSGRLCFILPTLPWISSTRKAPPRQNQRAWEHRQMPPCTICQPAYRRGCGCAHGCPPASARRAARPQSTCCSPRARGIVSTARQMPLAALFDKYFAWDVSTFIPKIEKIDKTLLQ